jgi:hypothetical protein
MLVGLVTTFRANRKEPLATVLARIHAAFRQSGEPDPQIEFVFADSGLPGRVSSVDRVLKRFPEMERFHATVDGIFGQPAFRQLSNQEGTTAENEVLDFPTLLAIAEGVPKSFPFHSIAIRFTGPCLGVLPPGFRPSLAALAQGVESGILVGDSWWIDGRSRSLQALAIVDVPATGKKLPPLPAAVQAIFAACGKTQKVNQVALGDSSAPSTASGTAATDAATPPAPTADSLQKIAALARDYRTRMPAILESNPLPHQLPPLADALKANLGQNPGEKKPPLVADFQPLGFRVRGGSGVFTLRRKTPTNLTVELTIDVGTWSNLATAHYAILGPGFSAGVPLPIAASAVGAPQYPIGDAAQWAKIVANLAALTQALDATLLPEVEALAGPVPEWFEP